MIKKNYSVLIIIIAGIIGLAIAILPILYGTFAVTFDQGRDFIWVSNQVIFRKPSLIGPWGSLTGVFFGPLWFWIMGLSYLLFGGSPISFTLINFIVVYSSVFFLIWLFRKKSKNLPVFLALMGFFSIGLRAISNYAFSQHMLPVLTLLFLYSITKFLKENKENYFYLSFFLAAIMFHAEPPVSLFSLPFYLFVIIKSENKKFFIKFKTWVLSITAFLLPFASLVLFDLRNNFLQGRAILSYIKGENKSLGDILPFGERIINRLQIFFGVFKSSVAANTIVALILLLLILFFYIKDKKDSFIKKFITVSFFYIVSLLIIFIAFPPELKNFYLDGLMPVFILWTGYLLNIIWKKNQKIICSLFVILLIFLNIEPGKLYKSLLSNYENRRVEGSVYKNQKEIVDWIYKNSEGNGFKVYVYVPAVYDYNYQYLFLDYGLKNYKYLPNEFAYLPNQPEYVQNKSVLLKKYESKIKKFERTVFLVIEKDFYQNRQEEWLNKFEGSKFKLIDRIIFPDETVVEKREAI